MRSNDTGGALLVPVNESDHVQGRSDAPITLVEYGDYECPYCGHAYPIVQEVQRRLGPSLRFVFRNFPLSEMHLHAERAAEAAEAAADQGRFWEMHDTLFEHQKALSDTQLIGYASSLGLDAVRVQRELASGVHRTKVRADFIGGARSGVNGTPTFFIDGVRYDGPWDLDSLMEALQARVLL